MINPTSRSLEWITEASRNLGVHDIALVEKTIRAFSLLEALARSGCPFLFKGGSSLMLHLNTSKRLSIDPWNIPFSCLWIWHGILRSME